MLWVTLGFMVACGDKEPATEEADADTDTDTDSDTDTDTDSDTDSDVEFTIASPDFDSSDGQPRADECDFWLPTEFTCDNPNPEITWEGVPEGTTHLILVFDDPDAGNYPHWAIWDIPANETGLDASISGEGVTSMLPGEAMEAENGFGWVGYLGSCPPNVHLYRWRLFPMDGPMTAEVSGSASQQFATVVSYAQENRIGPVARMCHLRGPA